MVYTSEDSTSNSIEVGPGNLRLLYSADEGKLTHYVNNRNKVKVFLMLQFSEELFDRLF